MIVLLVLLFSFSLNAQTDNALGLTPKQLEMLERLSPEEQQEIAELQQQAAQEKLKLEATIAEIRGRDKYAGQDNQVGGKSIAQPHIKPNLDIVFYGKVIDFEGQPVSGVVVKVNFSKFDPKVKDGTGGETLSFTTGADGIFVAKNRGYKLTIVSMEKAGYEFKHEYLYPYNSFSYYDKYYIDRSTAYSRSVPFDPKSKEPFVYKLRKYGTTDYLQVNDLGIYLKKSDGRPYYPLLLDTWIDEYGAKIDVKDNSSRGSGVKIDRKDDPDRCLEVSFDFSEDGKYFTLTFKAITEGSGLIMTNRPSNEAPENGYQKEVVYRNTMTNPNDKAEYIRGWKCEPFYIFVQGPNRKFYSRLEIELRTEPITQRNNDPEIRLYGKAYTNPFGRRYLDYDKKSVESERSFRKSLNYYRNTIESRTRQNKEVFNVIEFKKLVDQRYAGKNMEALTADIKELNEKQNKEAEVREEARLRAMGLWSDDPAERMRLQKEYDEQQRAEYQQMLKKVEQDSLRRAEEQRRRVEANLKARAKIAAEKAAAEKAAQEQAK